LGTSVVVALRVSAIVWGLRLPTFKLPESPT